MTKVVVTDHAFLDVTDETRGRDAVRVEFSVRSCRTEPETVLAPRATVIRYGIGYDDVEAAGVRGIAVATVPDHGSDAARSGSPACRRRSRP
ncbi:lactate dehydrogenase-like 2-hydroxyacid dehydrogenase [Actinoalloteichus hoggarensis]|uniref:Uncharacterized protein n=1 Tax=Actinoalloteichus hoggarensis TaxID=1470176 RepID=A0A221W4E0_9PSEU|nr:hypothetical protein [Actinoalloteichus hoggarensis]ASO20521.1 hypothetical protein AHOG_14395 [Actinoalloteichus hoggarensis]MBB5923561.1 lactate dehydrogenase-like 2-hydroxyacid dehydrogenase [Actinoalloteichus hoggarensis]